jgi:cbb3-type cytochrome oxidase maturation protein
MMDFEILGPYVVALLMSIGAVCVFVWGVLSGAFTDAEEVAIRVYRVEMENDRDRAHDDQPEE